MPHLLRGFPAPAKHCRTARLQIHPRGGFGAATVQAGRPAKPRHCRRRPSKHNTPILSTLTALRDDRSASHLHKKPAARSPRGGASRLRSRGLVNNYGDGGDDDGDSGNNGGGDDDG
jgi:hypothetical protein